MLVQQHILAAARSSISVTTTDHDEVFHSQISSSGAASLNSSLGSHFGPAAGAPKSSSIGKGLHTYCINAGLWIQTKVIMDTCDGVDCLYVAKGMPSVASAKVAMI